MGPYKSAFLAGRPTSSDVEYGYEYRFGPPATAEELDRCTLKLGHPLPDSLKAMLREFNGITYTSNADRKNGYGETELYFGTRTLHLPLEHLIDCGNFLPTPAELRRVVYFCNTNGWAVLWGICVEPVCGFAAHSVLRIDNDSGTFEFESANLLMFVREFKP